MPLLPFPRPCQDPWQTVNKTREEESGCNIHTQGRLLLPWPFYHSRTCAVVGAAVAQTDSTRQDAGPIDCLLDWEPRSSTTFATFPPRNPIGDCVATLRGQDSVCCCLGAQIRSGKRRGGDNATGLRPPAPAEAASTTRDGSLHGVLGPQVARSPVPQILGDALICLAAVAQPDTMAPRAHFDAVPPRRGRIIRWRVN